MLNLKNFKFLINLLFIFQTISIINTQTCFSNYSLKGVCEHVSNCTGATFISNCSDNKICCVQDPELSNFTYERPQLFNFSLKAFLNLAGDTQRNKALYPLFLKSMDESLINSCHKAATFFSQLAGETEMFTKFESEKPEKDVDEVLGNNQTGDGSKYRGRGAIHLRGKTNYQEANTKINNLFFDLINQPEGASFPVTAFKIASWFWNYNMYLIVNGSKAFKSNPNILADGTFHNFTMLTHALTNNLEFLKQRALIYEKAVDELKCSRIRRGKGISCELGKDRGYSVPICLLDFKKPFCGCDGKFDRSCPYGLNSQGYCRSSALIKCCIESCRRELDFVVLMDSSGSIKFRDFVKQKNFIKNLISRLEIGLNKTRFSLIKFSTDVEIITDFLSFKDKDSLFKIIDEMGHDSGLTNTVSALNVANDQVLQVKNGMRDLDEGVPKVVIVLTDGKSTESPELTIPTANKIKNRGINIISLGVGNDIDLNELEGIASSNDYVFTLENFDQFDDIIDTLTRSSCQQPASILPQKEVKTNVEKDEYKYFKMNLPERNVNKWILIELDNLKGQSEIFYSFDDKTPNDPSDYIEQNFSNESQNFFERSYVKQVKENKILIPLNGSQIVFIGIKGLDEVNEFKLKIENITDTYSTNPTTIKTSLSTTTTATTNKITSASDLSSKTIGPSTTITSTSTTSSTITSSLTNTTTLNTETSTLSTILTQSTSQSTSSQASSSVYYSSDSSTPIKNLITTSKNGCNSSFNLNYKYFSITLLMCLKLLINF